MNNKECILFSRTGYTKIYIINVVSKKIMRVYYLSLLNNRTAIG